MIWNEEQKAAILQRGGPCLVLAGPGSGKTAVVVNRVVCLARNGVPPEQILVLTFTRSAAAEMSARYQALSEVSRPPRETDSSADALKGVTFSTFHALCYHILKEEGVCESRAPADAAQKRKVAEQIVRNEYPDMDRQERARLVRQILEADAKQMTEAQIDARDPVSIDAKDPVSNDADIRHLALCFRTELRNNGMIDFPDMIRGCVDLFQRDPAALRKWQSRCRYIMVDEAQDMSRAQLWLAAMLAGDSAELFVVGDDDQSIYGFRGAHPRNMAGIAEITGKKHDIKIIVLSVNYRSVPEITRLAGRLISRNRERFRKHIRAYRQDPGQSAVWLRIFRNEQSEADAVAAEILIAKNEGDDLSETAVLCRTRGQLRAFLRALSERGIPYQCTEDPYRGVEGVISAEIELFYHLADCLRRYGALQPAELQNALSLLDSPLYAAGSFGEVVDPEAWEACFSKDPALFRRARKFIRDMQVLGTLRGEAFALYLLRAVGYELRLRKLCAKEGITFSRAEMLTRKWIPEKKTHEKSENKQADIFPSEEDNDCAVRVMTMHAAKGLEFRTVYLPSLNEGVIPHSSAKGREALEEERRLLYVAVTRAKECLRLSYVRRLHAHSPSPSRFLKEMLGEDYESYEGRR